MTRGPIIAWMTLLGIAQAAAPVAPRYPNLSNPLVQGYLATPQSASWLEGRPLAFQPGGTQSIDSLGAIDVNSPNYRYPGRAMVLSLMVPGAGQLYVGRPLKAVLFLGVEVAAIVTWDRYRRLGDSKTQAFKAAADEHWDFRHWLATFALYQTGQWGPEVGQVYVGPKGTHHLEFFVDMDGDGRPEIFGNTSDDSKRLLQLLASPDTNRFVFIQKNNEYYENIGKYNQFFSGWDDADPFLSQIEDRASGLIAITGNRTLYLQLRTETNQLKSIASYAVSALMFNHVISAVDAIFTSSRWNSAHARRLSGRLWFDPALAYGVGGLRVSLAW